MSGELFGEDAYLQRADHPSDPYRWIREYASHEDVVWALELSDTGRRRHLLELASRGLISDLDRPSLARFAALVIISQDRRSLGLA